jgi:putative glutamine amidotransferase
MVLMLTTRVDYYEKYNERRDCIDQNLVLILTRLGFDPVLVPNSLEDSASLAERIQPGGIVLSGGNDIAPEAYGGDPELSSNVSPQRDSTEMGLLRYAIDAQKPVLGICRGLQLINVFFSGHLVQDLGAFSGSTVDHVATRHDITLNEHFPIEQYRGQRITINSYHNQGIVDSCLSGQLLPMAYSDDNVVEALRHKSLNIFSINWHPEREEHLSKLDSDLIKSVFGK